MILVAEVFLLNDLQDFFNDWNRKVHRTKRWVETQDSGCRPSQQPEDDKDEEM